MNLYLLNPLIQKLPEFGTLATQLAGKSAARIKLSLPETALSFMAAAIYANLGKPVLFITAHPELARRRFEQVKLWLRADADVDFFPDIDLSGSTESADPVVNSERVKILSLLSRYKAGANADIPAPFILTSALSLSGKCIGEDALLASTIEIKNGMKIKQSVLLENMQKLGYEYEEVVEIPGTFGKRGGIIDIFPAGRGLPVRIEFFGDEIESVREYDPRTQRSDSILFSLTILPAMEQAPLLTASLLDYLPDDAILIIDDIGQLEAEVTRVTEGAERSKSGEDNEGSGSKCEAALFTWKEVLAVIDSRSYVIEFSNWDTDQVEQMAKRQLQLRPAPNFAQRFSAFVESLPGLRTENKRVLIVSQQAERIRELLLDHAIDVYPAAELAALPGEGVLTLMKGSLDGGWRLSVELLLLTDVELFGIIKQRRATKARPVRHHRLLNDISVGDLVVHVEHGIGRFAGVARKTVDSVEREYLVLQYAGSDTLYVPVDQVDRVSLYIGGSDRVPSLSRLGSQEWHRAQQKVRDSVAKIAGELVDLYANREVGGGLAFSPDTLWQQELEASFPYIETRDQLDAIAAVKSDMQSPRPMDRLVCGDVGYGKTEIALRAAFKAVMDGRQVAVLVPTTILAQQHLNTFSERLSPFPVKITSLSRFCSQKEQSDIIHKLADGYYDICIGTHRMLQKDVVFKDLGLVIIDEEQRFGVVHKEYFKKMRQTVDVLTLSATPIPRTMHMALSGIRDMSTIETPPESRLPVITHVGGFNGKLVREAVLRELERDGQVFIVHNRVHSINELALKVGELVPEARLSIAHGQMDEDKLEKIMADFVAGDTDVLLTTTIIESGLDMPNVNTLIVDGADRLGLTQLYQLRGRVGRGANTAYAYFLFDLEKNMTEQARERLKTIAQATELGSGFAIAMKDLEIRGAGNLLGVEQSGNIAAVGFNYYCRLLAEAVEAIKAKTDGCVIKSKVEEPVVSIDLKIPAFIPEYYIENTRARFNIYQRMAKISELSEINDIALELIDRFGQTPEEVANLLYVVELRKLAQEAGAESIFRDQETITISLYKTDEINMQLLKAARQKAIRIGNKQIKLDIQHAGNGWKMMLKELISELAVKRHPG
ncbi:MAG: transcription-repair coupling factor [Chloroflexi bacterium]|nr:transcription-repair coupling factor [Chloroflexota bacterium]